MSSSSRATAAGRSTALMGSSEGVGAALAGADAHQLFHGGDPDLPVADPTRPGGVRDRVDHLGRAVVVAEHLDLYLRDEVDLVLGPPVDLGVAALAPEPLDLRRGEPVDAKVAQG